MHNVLKIEMGVKLHIISYRVWDFYVAKQGVLGAQTFFTSDQIRRVDWNWSDAQFLHELTFFCAILSFWDMIDFVYFLRDLDEIWKHFFFLNGSFTRPHPTPRTPPPDSVCYRIHTLVGTGYRQRHISQSHATLLPCHTTPKSEVAVNYCTIQNQQ